MSEELVKFQEKQKLPEKSSRKTYLTLYLPGDVVLAKDGSIGLIVKANCIIEIRPGSQVHCDWNYMWKRNLVTMPKVLQERYSLDVIPGYPCGKCAWWKPDEFEQVLKGPLHEVLGGRRSDFAPRDETDHRSRSLPSTIAPFGRLS